MGNNDHGSVRDRELGIGCPITRRESLNAVGIVVGASLAGASPSGWKLLECPIRPSPPKNLWTNDVVIGCTSADAISFLGLDVG